MHLRVLVSDFGDHSIEAFQVLVHCFPCILGCLSFKLVTFLAFWIVFHSTWRTITKYLSFRDDQSALQRASEVVSIFKEIVLRPSSNIGPICRPLSSRPQDAMPVGCAVPFELNDRFDCILYGWRTCTRVCSVSVAGRYQHECQEQEMVSFISTLDVDFGTSLQNFGVKVCAAANPSQTATTCIPQA